MSGSTTNVITALEKTKAAPKSISAVMGTTHFTNAVICLKSLTRTAIIVRIGLRLPRLALPPSPSGLMTREKRSAGRSFMAIRWIRI
jgi:hypothetical protein